MTLRQFGPDLDQLIGAVERFEGDPATTSRVVSALADTAERLVYSTFTAGRSPDGAPWAPLKRPRVGIGGPLLLSGELRDEASRPTITSTGFVMEVTSPKGVHQRGYKRREIAARPFYPTADLPIEWERALEASAAAALDDVDG